MKNTSTKKIIIIGAGLSGLSAGIYARLSGFDVEIFEKNPVAGGLCTSWYRKGYKIDGCIHWLTGTNDYSCLKPMWKTIGAWEDEDLIQGDNFGTIEYQGQKLVMWNDSKKLEEELLRISPEDKKEIRKFIKYFDKSKTVDFPLEVPTDIASLGELMKMGPRMLPNLPLLAKTATISCERYSRRFKSPLIRYFLNNIVPGKNNLYSNIFSYATVASYNGGVPKGGSKDMMDKVLKRYLELGGKIHYVREVEQILTEKRKAVGIRLKNGEEHFADYVVSCVDILYVLEHLLKRKYRSNRFHSRLEKIHKYPIPSCLYVTYSVDAKKYKDLGLTTTYQFDTKPFRIGYTSLTSIRIRDYSFDESFIHNGRVPINVLIDQTDINYPFWKMLSRDRKAYLAEKEQIGDRIKNIIEEKFPSLKGDLELLDVATPFTYHRYCNSSYGGYMSFAWTSRNMMLMHNGKIRKIKNLYVSGQWTQMPGGLPLALASGKFSIQRILKKEHRDYHFPPKEKRRKANDK